MITTAVSVPDLTDPLTYAQHDMTNVWRRLRSDDPVYWHPGTSDSPGFWVISRHADVARVLRDDAGYTTEGGNVLSTMLQGGDAGAGRMMALTDGPRHTQLRKLLLKAFTPRVLGGVVTRVREAAAELVLQGIERGACDFARDIASVIPLETICDLLDVPIADRQEILSLTRSALASDYASPEASADRVARSEILFYFSDLVTARRKSPGSDPISLMATATVDGERLSDEDIILNCYSLIMGGDETSRLAMIGAVRCFMDNPGQWQALKSGAVSVESATEEVLRWTTPTMHFGRTAAADVALHGQAIARGELVTLWLASANRDERVFAEPDRFVLARSPNRHLSLGYGRHFCLGAYLGRAEIGAMLSALRVLVRRIEPAGPERWLYSNFLSGISSLPVIMKGEPDGRDAAGAGKDA